MEIGQTFTHNGVEYTVTSVEGDTVKGVSDINVDDIHGEVNHGHTRRRRISIAIENISG